LAAEQSSAFWYSDTVSSLFSQPASIKTAVTASATGVRWRALQLLRNDE
jgi:hypothetical protein